MRWPALLLAAASPLAGCDRETGPRVVLYASVDEHLARQVIASFEESTGIDVVLLGDTEAKKTTGLVRRLRRSAR